MPLSQSQKESIRALLSDKIEKKLENYGRETTSMPFLARLMQDSKKIAAYSFIQSISTTLGMSVYEEVSVILARESADKCFRKYDVVGFLSKEQKSVIDDIVRELRNKERRANIEKEIEEVLQVPPENGKYQKSGEEVDFYMKRGGQEFYFEIKTPKPNIGVIEKTKTQLLEWVARRGQPIRPYLVFPYNPYHPKPYNRFTLQGLMDPGNDFLVAEEYWDFLSGEGTYLDLLEVFDEVGKHYKKALEEKFAKIAKEKIDSR